MVTKRDRPDGMYICTTIELKEEAHYFLKRYGICMKKFINNAVIEAVEKEREKRNQQALTGWGVTPGT